MTGRLTIYILGGLVRGAALNASLGVPQAPNMNLVGVARHRKPRGPGRRRGPGHAPTPPPAEPLLGPPARATLAGAGLTQEGAGPSDGLRARHGRQLPFPPASDGGVRVGCHRPCGCWWPGSSARGRVAGLFQVGVSAISVPPVSLRGTRPLVAAHTRLGACSPRGVLPGPPFRESLCLAQGAASALTPSWRGRELSSTPSAQSHLVSNHLRV